MKPIRPDFPENKIYYEKRHFSTRACYEKIQEPFHIKTFNPNPIGNYTTTKEFSLENRIQAKRKISDLDSLRNGILCKIPGNKCFKNPEYSLEFFKEGGLVPGSTNTFNFKRNSSKKSNNFYDTLNLTAHTLDPDKLWLNKIRKENFEYDSLFVKTLHQWDQKVLRLKELKKIEADKNVNKKGGVANISGRRDNKKGATSKTQK